MMRLLAATAREVTFRDTFREAIERKQGEGWSRRLLLCFSEVLATEDLLLFLLRGFVFMLGVSKGKERKKRK